MKLAEIIGNAKNNLNSGFSTYQIVEKYRATKIAKDVFNALKSGIFYKNRQDKEWGEIAETILQATEKFTAGFQKDIAKKALQYVSLSDKQAWCVSYSFVEITENLQNGF